MAFIPPMIAAVAGFATTVAPIVSAVAGVASIASALRKPKMPTVASTSNTPSVDPAAVVPLPVDTGTATKLRLLQTKAQAAQRAAGLGGTLVGGQLGDVSPPKVAAPLVLGRAA
jgi:hypothetical protein